MLPHEEGLVFLVLWIGLLIAVLIRYLISLVRMKILGVVPPSFLFIQCFEANHQ